MRFEIGAYRVTDGGASPGITNTLQLGTDRQAVLVHLVQCLLQVEFPGKHA
ncbi:hypothetical protein D3C81_2225180 [compost metagenome]